MHCLNSIFLFFFFFNDTAPTEIYTLSLHDALPIYAAIARKWAVVYTSGQQRWISRFSRHRGIPMGVSDCGNGDRKSTRLNSSHTVISYAVFCLKKKK